MNNTIDRQRVAENYRKATISLLRRMDEPTVADVQYYLCDEHCPVIECAQTGGTANSFTCGHVARVKHQINRILDMFNE
jgi:hypothetical protein